MKTNLPKTTIVLLIACFIFSVLACQNPISSNPGTPVPSSLPAIISIAPTVTLPLGESGVANVAESAMVAPATISGNFRPIGKAYDITLSGQTGPISFAPNYAVLSFPYDKASLKVNGLLDEFSVFYFDTGTATWKTVDKVEIDFANSKIKAYSTHFTTFVATAALEQPTGVQPPPAGILADYPSGIGGSGHAVFSLLGEGYLYYQDRAYTIKPLSASIINTTTFSALGFEGAIGVSTLNGGTVADPYSVHKLFEGDDYINFIAKRDLDVYVMYDTRGGSGPNDTTKDAPWLSAKGFTATISTTSIPAPTRYFVETTDAVGQYAVYKKTYATNDTVHLDGNRKGVTDPGIQTNYWVIIKAKDNYSSNSASDVSVSPVDKTPPSEVGSLVANSADGGVRLSWVAPPDADFVKVIITYSPGAVAPYILAKGTNTADISGLTNGTPYTFRVRTVDGSNNISIGKNVSVTPVVVRKVSYDGNGSTSGTVPFDSTTYSVGQSAVVQGNSGGLLKTGNAFGGWNTTADGNGNSYTQGGSFSLNNSDVRLYAVWIPNNFKFTSSANRIEIIRNIDIAARPTGNLVIPGGVTSIGALAFIDADLTSVYFPTSIQNIGDEAFYSKQNLVSFNIPANLNSIAETAFGQCPVINDIQVDPANAYYQLSGKVLFNKSGTVLVHALASLSGTYKIPASVSTIYDSAFYGNKLLTDITIPEGMNRLSNQAFMLCSALVNVSLPNSLLTIDNAAFAECHSLKTIPFPVNVTSIGVATFAGCTSLTEVIIPSGVVSITNNSFMGCSSLNHLVIPEGVTIIGDHAFLDCVKLTSIVIPSTITKLVNEAFRGCSELSVITSNALMPPICYTPSLFMSCNKIIAIKVPAASIASYQMAWGFASIIVANN